DVLSVSGDTAVLLSYFRNNVLHSAPRALCVLLYSPVTARTRIAARIGYFRMNCARPGPPSRSRPAQIHRSIFNGEKDPR
ncbi:hypothetical protein, partial [Kocuria sp. NPDC057446]|uniref:hypothetical protein n=1 Tax=Kocuria sp. NPDC057446 TaxID=3346137 RepID=UPI0036D20854